jgi:hypothetical protein
MDNSNCLNKWRESKTEDIGRCTSKPHQNDFAEQEEMCHLAMPDQLWILAQLSWHPFEYSPQKEAFDM